MADTDDKARKRKELMEKMLREAQESKAPGQRAQARVPPPPLKPPTSSMPSQAPASKMQTPGVLSAPPKSSSQPSSQPMPSSSSKEKPVPIPDDLKRYASKDMMDADELDYDRKPMPPPPRPTSASPQSSVSKPADKPSDEKKSGGFNFPSFGGMFGAKPAAAATGAAAAAASTAALAAASAAASAAQKKQSVIQPTMTSRKPAQAAQPRGKPEGPLRGIAKRISASMPDLRKKLREAGMNNDPVAFVQGALIGTIVMGLAFTLILFMLFDLFGIDKTLLVLLFPILLIASFMWQLQLPKAKARKRAKLVDRELVFAGRQMLIELKAGVPLFDAMLSISRDYGEVSKEFAKIAERVNAGVPTDLAMHDIAEDNPSMAFKRVLLQLINSIRSGSDVASALESVLDQISREQITEMKAYGQKLNPLGMFYMIFGIIMPSLGIALAIIIFSFLSISITSTILYSVLIPVIIMQYVFLTIIESQKPDYEL